MNGVGLMSAQRKYPPELRERAVRLYKTARPQPSMRALAAQLGVNPEALRSWIHRDAEAAAARPARGARRPAATAAAAELPADVAAELDALRVEVMQLRRSNEILRAASAYFAVAADQTGRWSWGSSTNTGTHSGSRRSSGN
jgi:transposase